MFGVVIILYPAFEIQETEHCHRRAIIYHLKTTIFCKEIGDCLKSKVPVFGNASSPLGTQSRARLAIKMQKMHKIFRSRTIAAPTGICRSGGSADTLIRESIRVSGCHPIHIRLADSAACRSIPLHPCFSLCLCLPAVALAKAG